MGDKGGAKAKSTSATDGLRRARDRTRHRAIAVRAPLLVRRYDEGNPTSAAATSVPSVPSRARSRLRQLSVRVRSTPRRAAAQGAMIPGHPPPRPPAYPPPHTQPPPSAPTRPVPPYTPCHICCRPCVLTWSSPARSRCRLFRFTSFALSSFSPPSPSLADPPGSARRSRLYTYPDREL